MAVYIIPVKGITINKIYIGNKQPKAIYIGEKEVKEIYKGSTCVYKKIDTSVGIDVVLYKINDSTSLSGSTLYITSTDDSTQTVTGKIEIPKSVYNFELRCAALQDGSIVYKENQLITKYASSGAGTWTDSRNTPFYLHKWAYQPNNTTSTITRGQVTLMCVNLAGVSPAVMPKMKFDIIHLGSTTVTSYSLTVYFCNFYTGTSIMSFQLVASWNGTASSDSTGGGMVGTQTWANQRTLKLSTTKTTAGILTQLNDLTVLNNSGGYLSSFWQIRVNSSAPTYANRKTAGTAIESGTEKLDGSIDFKEIYNYNFSSGNRTLYMWFCEGI